MRPCHLAPSESKYLRICPEKVPAPFRLSCARPRPSGKESGDAPSVPGTEARRSEGSEKNPTNDRTSAEGHKARRTFTSLSAGPETATPHPTYRPRKALRQSRFPRTANRPAIPQKPGPASRKRRRSSPNASETTSYRNSSGDGRDDSPAEARNAAVRPAPVRRPVRPKGGPTARTAFRRADSRLRRPCR